MPLRALPIARWWTLLTVVCTAVLLGVAGAAVATEVAPEDIGSVSGDGGGTPVVLIVAACAAVAFVAMVVAGNRQDRDDDDR